MPLFRATALSAGFLEVFLTSTAPVTDDVRAYRLSVLSSESRARSVLVLVHLIGKKDVLPIPDWNTTIVGEKLAAELKLDNPEIGGICVYDPEDDHFHQVPVSFVRKNAFGDMSGAVGWKDLEAEFDLYGVTPSGNLVLVAKKGHKCTPRSLFDAAPSY